MRSGSWFLGLLIYCNTLPALPRNTWNWPPALLKQYSLYYASQLIPLPPPIARQLRLLPDLLFIPSQIIHPSIRPSPHMSIPSLTSSPFLHIVVVPTYPPETKHIISVSLKKTKQTQKYIYTYIRVWAMYRFSYHSVIYGAL